MSSEFEKDFIEIYNTRIIPTYQTLVPFDIKKACKVTYDFQQQKIDKLEKQLAEAEKVIEYYADPVNHEFDDHHLQEDEELMEFYEVHDEKGHRLSVQPLNNGLDELFEGYVAGKRARQYFKNKEK